MTFISGQQAWNKGVFKLNRHANDMVEIYSEGVSIDNIAGNYKTNYSNVRRLLLSKKVVFRKSNQPDKHLAGRQITISEEKLNSLIKENNFSFSFCGSGDNLFSINGAYPDFVNKEEKKVIELQDRRNCHWLNKRLTKYKEYGYDCLVIYVYDLNNHVDKVKERIKSFLLP